MKKWYLLITSLPTENATARMRIWRSLKASGAAVLRDGVYLMPDRADCLETFESLALEVKASGGTALVLKTDEPASESFIALFDRSADYASLLADISKLSSDLVIDSAQDQLKQVRKLRKAFTSLAAIDFFPGEAQQQTDTALRQLELAIARLLSPDEPHPAEGTIATLSIADFQGKTWATRQRPWVDRLACAWLIRRFIDPQAHLLWLPSPDACPNDAMGFDFDGARFSHIDGRVTFEVLLASFDLETPALKRLGSLVHFLDVGGVQPPEAVGIESVLAGLRDAIADDDQLLAVASAVFDSLLVTFEKGVNNS
ncbi:chromate resistance protein ChrB domain-containing protein [Methylomonas sp. ZR1]|uniref:chromate resistance protein ChrB domain-containing protein n=1 Tax=Methylomonas sp. ZR1 TaxID=1797072 RepID=UPI001490B9E5|nr:chromate resistance protein ChrB domain-containing protein [Methylomonas sp. ZR1]NOV31393.1 chromate resistance protein [Methylomonas sp. ZR1]